jgi:hypothetical protein
VQLQIAIPDEYVGPRIINPVLEATTRLNEQMIRDGKVPTFDEALKKGLVHWQNEPPGAERFDHAGTVLARGWGDCDDLAPWACASDRVTGKDPGCKADIFKSGPDRWHAIHKRSDGSRRDPSKEAGMNSVSGIAPAVVPLMYQAPSISGDAPRPAIALRRIVTTRGEVGYDSRVDLPFMLSSDYALAASARRRRPQDAIVDAIIGACRPAMAAECADPEHLARLDAIASIMSGHDPDQLMRELGEAAVVGALPFVESAWQLSGDEVIGFNFGKFLKVLGPIASKVVSFIPGVGPVAATAIDVSTDIATKLLEKKPINPMQAVTSAMNMISPTPLTRAVADVLKTAQGVVDVTFQVAPTNVAGDGSVGWNLFHAISHIVHDVSDAAAHAIHAFQHIAKDLGPFGFALAMSLGLPPDLGTAAATLLMASHAGDPKAKAKVKALADKSPEHRKLFEGVSDEIRHHKSFGGFHATAVAARGGVHGVARPAPPRAMSNDPSVITARRAAQQAQAPAPAPDDYVSQSPPPDDQWSDAP